MLGLVVATFERLLPSCWNTLVVSTLLSFLSCWLKLQTKLRVLKMTAKLFVANEEIQMDW
jgi:hypothetical protein